MEVSHPYETTYIFVMQHLVNLWIKNFISFLVFVPHFEFSDNTSVTLTVFSATFHKNISNLILQHVRVTSDVSCIVSPIFKNYKICKDDIHKHYKCFQTFIFLYFYTKLQDIDDICNIISPTLNIQRYLNSFYVTALPD